MCSLVILMALVGFINNINAQLQSPCPAMFVYDPEPAGHDTWSATISILPETDYAGIWLRLVFDRPVLDVSSDFGESVQREPNEYLIRQSKHQVLTGEQLLVRVTVRYGLGAVPRLLGLRLNGRVLCPSNGIIPTTPSPDVLVSPCPRLFKYETSGGEIESDRWHGIIELQSERELSGIWLRLVLDRPSIQLGNWFGEVTTDDNKEYLIKNRQTKLRPGEVIPIRFFVKYNPAEPIPKLEKFRLNAEDVCPETVSASTTTIRPQTPRPAGSSDSGKPGWVKPDSAPKPDSSIFGSDFDPQSRPVFLPERGGNTPCGLVAAQPRPLITHGTTAAAGQFPWHAALYYPKGIDLQYICGASLISLRHTITAAHCVTRRASDKPVDTEDVEVYLGKYHLRQFASPGIQNRQVSRIIVHPEYNHRYYANDIALLALASAAEYTDFVRPVCLWSSRADIQDIVDKEGTVVGWGYDHTGKVTETLTKASMPVVSHPKCIWSYPEFFSKFANDKTFCAGFRNGTSVCNGDSGGGLVFPKAAANPNQRAWQLRGVVSISVALQSEFVCDTSHYAIFTDVAKYMSWIQQNLI